MEWFEQSLEKVFKNYRERRYVDNMRVITYTGE